ncbi:LacI family DNA-binding transcriptional regulator [Aquibacillus sediminis]|uniref:LacI family DNA-binding transcriptional regulator n=1 Tax=Aquibacillus sediminis TaxID=2574734 RepID=UPI001108BB5E|nr:LacI family DNA-binding transcriptional regulator [Aquibacillus sediminis]
MPTIKEIAEMANVSRSTVSRALNNSGYVSEDARKRIEKVIKQTGYVPSEHAKALRTKKTKVIGVILPTIQTETSSKVVAGIDQVLANQGYQILLANTHLDREKEMEYVDLLKVRQVDGIILIATNTEDSLAKKLEELTIPVVVIGQEFEQIPSIVYDNYQAGRDVVSYLISKGHRQIGFVGVDEKDQAVGYLRKQAYLDEMETQQLSVEDTWIQRGVFDIDSGYDAAKRMIQHSNQRPTAIFAVTDRLAIGVMSYLKEVGLQVPKDVAIISIGASEISQYTVPALTTVDYHNEQAGIKAAEQILAYLDAKKISKKITLDYRLIIRNSV